MRIERKIIKATRVLAGKLFRVKAKPGETASRLRHEPVTELWPCDEGTRLVVRRGQLSLSRVISDTRIDRDVAFSYQWLQACQGTRGEVELTLGEEAADFRWDDKGFPAALHLAFQEAEELPYMPSLSVVDSRLMTALAVASGAVDHQSSRYALHCVQLDGQRGTVTGTDGRQLIRFDGFKFPWNDQAILAPASDVFGCPELQGTTSVACGITGTQLVIQAEPWTLHLPLEQDARYPNVEAVIGRYSKAINRVYFDPRDLEFFAANVRHIPGADQQYSPLTLDLNGHVELAARGDSQSQSVRIRLSRSVHVGQRVCCTANRHYLHLAAKLGLTELLRFGECDPLVCRGEHVVHLWQPLSGVTPPENGPGTITIDSAGSPVSST